MVVGLAVSKIVCVWETKAGAITPMITFKEYGSVYQYMYMQYVLRTYIHPYGHVHVV